jgi:hypothetical protein
LSQVKIQEKIKLLIYPFLPLQTLPFLVRGLKPWLQKSCLERSRTAKKQEAVQVRSRTGTPSSAPAFSTGSVKETCLFICLAFLLLFAFIA